MNFSIKIKYEVPSLLSFFISVTSMSYYVYCKMWFIRVHGPVRPYDLGYLRDRLLILLFWLILRIYLIRCIALTLFASVSFSQRYISRVLILLETISFVYIFSLSRSHAFQWFPTGLSFYFTLPALSSSGIYLLLTKHAGIIPYRSLQYLSFIYFCRLCYRTPCSSYPSEILSAKFRHLHTFLLSSLSLKISSWSDFSMLLRFFLSEVIPMFNLLLCLNSTLFRRNVPLILLCTYQGSFSIHSHPLISSSRAPIFYFSHSSHLSSSLIVPRLLSKSVCTPTPSVTACTAFSVFFQFAWNRFLSWSWSALPSVSFFQPLFFSVAHGLLRRVDA